MKPKQMMLFAVAIGCGLVAMVGAQQVLSGNKPAEQEIVKILVAKTDIDPGVPLDKMNVGFREWPKNNVPEGAITSEEEFAEHALRIRVSFNMPILAAYLGPKGAAGVSSMIPDGMQLVTLPVDSTMTHSGLLRPGSFVAITCAIDRPDRNGRETYSIKTVLKRVKVIAVGDRIAGTEVATKEATPVKVENISFVTFPRQAKLLNLAKVVSKGRMQFALLGQEDKSAEDDKDLAEDDLAQRSAELFGDKNIDQVEKLLANPTMPVAQPQQKPKPTGSSFSEYLKQQPVPAEVADLGKRPSRATWVIEIYNGDKKERHELELPEEPVEAPPEQPPATSDVWTTPLMQFFSRKRPAKPAIQESEVKSDEDLRPELTNDKSAAGTTKTTRR